MILTDGVVLPDAKAASKKSFLSAVLPPSSVTTGAVCSVSNSVVKAGKFSKKKLEPIRKTPMRLTAEFVSLKQSSTQASLPDSVPGNTICGFISTASTEKSSVEGMKGKKAVKGVEAKTCKQVNTI